VDAASPGRAAGLDAVAPIMREALVATEDERFYRHDGIDLVSTAYYGDGAYGIRDASAHYFGVPPSRLDAAQASLLAGLICAPSAYDPETHPVDDEPPILRMLERALVAAYVVFLRRDVDSE
jgi:membrane peptidoglycan carboxypeptidase